MTIFKTAPFHIDALYPQQAVDAAVEKGYDIHHHGPLYHIGIYQDLVTGLELRSWWFAEDLNAEPAVVPEGWTVLETAALFDREGMDTDDQTVNVALELLLQGVATSEIPFLHDRIFRDVNGVYRSRWFAQLRGPQNPALQRLSNAVVQHGGSVLGAVHDTNSQVGGNHCAQSHGATLEHDEGQIEDQLSVINDHAGTKSGAQNANTNGEASESSQSSNQATANATAPTVNATLPVPVPGSANDASTHAFPCPLPACTIKGRTMSRRALIVIHMREHGCNLPSERGGPKDKTAYNKMQNKVVRSWLDARGISWRGSVFELGADDEEEDEDVDGA
ncbi:hypothetical protein LTR86_001300 [Recurvomyces mirabilis]|nr:hypothetical protein LTR86_001300 [Recurvomyces mirabilis]